MENSDVSYVICIAATSERLWAALTNPDALREYWGGIRSEWTIGSRVEEVSEEGELLWEGNVLASDTPRSLSFTFDVAGSDEKPTKVCFEIAAPVSKVKPSASVVRLAVTQVGFAEGSKLRSDCERAWTEILSSLKSYIESGRALPFDWKH